MRNLKFSKFLIKTKRKKFYIQGFSLELSLFGKKKSACLLQAGTQTEKSG